MGRPREHDQQAVRARLMRCFWELGFEGASITALEAAAGVNRRQLSRDYGNKRAIFLQSLDDFTGVAGQVYLDRLERPDARVAEIAATLKLLAGSRQQPLGHLGCLICNTSLEPIATQDDSVRETVHGFFQRIERAYANALRLASRHGEVSLSPRQAKAATRQLLGAHIALLCLARSRMPDAVLADIANRTLASLTS